MLVSSTEKEKSGQGWDLVEGKGRDQQEPISLTMDVALNLPH